MRSPRQLNRDIPGRSPALPTCFGQASRLLERDEAGADR